MSKLSNALQSDVMADGSISARYNISTHRSVNLGSDITLPQERLLEAFRQVLARKPAKPLIDEQGKAIKATICVEDNGTALIRVGSVGFAFAHAGLLSPDSTARREYLERYLRVCTLARVYADQLRSKVSDKKLSNDEFLTVIEALFTAQESFIQTVRVKVANRELTNFDLLPDDVRHWENLVAPWSGSRTLEEFMSSECEAERTTRLAESPSRAFYTSSLSYCAPALVPIDKFGTVAPDVMLQVLERAASLPDHFALAGAFEICGDWLNRNSRFEAVGAKLLDQLLGNMEVLKEKCTIYAAIFAMTLARLAQHQTLRRKPPFWRRVTAAAHASLVVRACGSNNADNMLQRVMERFGKAFLFSVLLEGAEEPRWKPDWLSTMHLVADAFGRVDAAINKIPEQSRPEAWIDRIAKAREWIADNHLGPFCQLPAIGQSARQKQRAQEETFGFQPHYQKLCDEPNVDALLMCELGFYTVGVTKETLRACHAVMSQLQKDGSRWDEGNTRYVLQILSFVSVQTQDAALADSVAEFCIERTRELGDDDSTLEIVCRLLECASANTNHVNAMKALARRLEAVGFLAPASALIDLYDSLSDLKLLDETLSQSLGKAIAASRLGRKAA